MAAFEKNMKIIKNKYKYQTIGFDKINMLRHVRFFKDIDGMKAHMKKHKEILRPRFDLVLSKIKENLEPLGIISYEEPKGGYFVSLNVLPGCAKRVYELAKEVGVTLTPAGAPFPYGIDPEDKNLRIAPSYPPVSELEDAVGILCLCVRIASLEKYLA